MIRPQHKNFSKFKPKSIAFTMIRKAIENMRQYQVRADLSGNLNFRQMPDGHWKPFDERDSWLCGKPVGAS